MRKIFSLILICITCVVTACGSLVEKKGGSLIEIDIESIVDEAGLEEVEIDREIFADGNESLKNIN